MRLTVSRRTALTGATGLAAATILRRPAHAAEFSYKFASVLPPDHPMILRCVEAVAKIKEQTGGRLDITVYPNSALGADTAMLAQCVSGAVEMYALEATCWRHASRRRHPGGRLRLPRLQGSLARDRRRTGRLRARRRPRSPT